MPSDPRVSEILDRMASLNAAPSPTRNPRIDAVQAMIAGATSAFSGSSIPMDIVARQRKNILDQDELELARTRQQAEILRNQLDSILNVGRTDADLEQSRVATRLNQEELTNRPTLRRQQEQEFNTSQRERQSNISLNEEELTNRPTLRRQQEQELNASQRERQSNIANNELDKIRKTVELHEFLTNAERREVEAGLKIDEARQRLETAKTTNERVRAELDLVGIESKVEKERWRVAETLIKNNEPEKGFMLMDRHYQVSSGGDLTDTLKNISRDDEDILNNFTLNSDIDPDKSEILAKQAAMDRYNLYKNVRTKDNPNGIYSPELGTVAKAIQDVEIEWKAKEAMSDQNKFYTSRADPDTGDVVNTIEKSRQYQYLDRVRAAMNPSLIQKLKNNGEWEDLILEISEKMPEKDIRHISRYLQGVDDRQIKQKLSPKARQKMYTTGMGR